MKALLLLGLLPQLALAQAQIPQCGPAAIPPLPVGAVLILEASNTDGANNLGLTNGSPVAQWVSTGTATDAAVQATPSHQPLLRTAALNGKAVVNFDHAGDGQGLFAPLTQSLAFLHQTGIFDLVIVQRRSFPGANTLFTNVPNNDTSQGGFWFKHATNNGGIYWVITRGVGIGIATATTFSTSGVVPIGVWRILEVAGDGSQTFAYVDARGAPEAQAFANALATAAPASNGFAIGEHTDTIGPSSVDIAAIYVWSRKLNPTERAAMLAYVAAVWGV